MPRTSPMDRPAPMPRSAARASFPLFPVAVLALLVSACGGADEPAPEPDPLVGTDPPADEMTEADYGELEPSEVGLNTPWSRNTVSRDPNPNAPTVSLVGVRTSQSRGYDRVVFTFAESIPGYRLAFSSAAGGGCDGTEAISEAAEYLVVELSGARANDGGTPLIDDRDRATDFPALANAVQSCDEDGTVRWILGAAGGLNYRIMEMRGEPRLVVDLGHP